MHDVVHALQLNNNVRRLMRALALCFIVLVLTGCDTLSGRTVVAKLKPGGQSVDASLKEALAAIDKTMSLEGAKRVDEPATDTSRVADYIGGPFICSVFLQGDTLTVDFRNPYFGVGAGPEVKRASDAVAECLRIQYGSKQVRIKD